MTNRTRNLGTEERRIVVNSSADDLPKRYHLLGIGIDEYRDSAIADLSTAVDEVLAVSAFLEEHYGFQSTLVLKPREEHKGQIDCRYYSPNKDKIIELLQNYGNRHGGSKLTNDDALLIYYAGHGELNKEGTNSFFLTEEAFEDKQGSWFSHGDFLKELDAIKARYILVIANSCFSGALLGARRANESEQLPPIAQIARLRSREVLTSGRIEQVDDNFVFANALLEALKRPIDGYLLTDHLFKRISDYMEGHATKHIPSFGIMHSKDADKQARFIFSHVNGGELHNTGDSAKERIIMDKLSTTIEPPPAPSKPQLRPYLSKNPDLQGIVDNDIFIHGDSFQMGSPEDEDDRHRNESPQHEVQIADFYLARYPVTRAEYARFIQAMEEQKKDDEKPHSYDSEQKYKRAVVIDQRPIMGISWEDAQKYVAWLSKETGLAYRLPSEAEWEFACRAGSKTRFWWGDDPYYEQAHLYANFGGNHKGPTEVGSFYPNDWGLYDMSGNVGEWVQDCWKKNYYEAYLDGKAWTEGFQTKRVARGGGFDSDPEDLRSASRTFLETEVYFYRDYGFRIARTPGPQLISSQLIAIGNRARRYAYDRLVLFANNHLARYYDIISVAFLLLFVTAVITAVVIYESGSEQREYEAQRKEDEANWQLASSANTISSYQKYIDDCEHWSVKKGSCMYTTMARHGIIQLQQDDMKRWERASIADTLDSYENYIAGCETQYCASEHLAKANAMVAEYVPELWLEEGLPSSAINDIAYTPDSSAIATALRNGEIKLWDATTGSHIRTIKAHSAEVSAIAFSSDGNIIGSASYDGTLKLWDAQFGEFLRSMETNHTISNSISFAKDGKTLFADDKLFDVDTGKLLRTFGSGGYLSTLSNDGELLAVARRSAQPILGKKDFIDIWDIGGSKEKLMRSIWLGFQVEDDQGKVRIFNYGLIQTFDFVPNSGSIVFSETWGNDVSLLDWQSNSHFRLVEHYHTAIDGEWVNDLDFAPDGYFLGIVSSREDKVRVISGLEHYSDSVSPRTINILKDNSASPEHIAFAPSQKTLATAGGNMLSIWHLNKQDDYDNYLSIDVRDPDHIEQVHSEHIHLVAFSPNGDSIVSAAGDYSMDATIKLWDTLTGNVKQTLVGHADRINDIAFSSDGSILASVSDDRSAKLWDINSGELLHSFKENNIAWEDNAEKRFVALSPNNKLLATSSFDGSVLIWEINSGGKRMILDKKYTSPYNPKRDIISFTQDSSAIIIDRLEEQAVRAIELWDVNSGELLSRVRREYFPDLVQLPYRSPREGSTIYTHIKGSVVQFISVDLNDSEPMTVSQYVINGSQSNSSESCGWPIAHNTKFLALRCTDDSLKIWNVFTGELEKHTKALRYLSDYSSPPFSFPEHYTELDLPNNFYPIQSYALSPGGNALVAAIKYPLSNTGKTIIIWDLDRKPIFIRDRK